MESTGHIFYFYFYKFALRQVSTQKNTKSPTRWTHHQTIPLKNLYPIPLLYEYWDLHITNASNKNRLSFMRSNPIGHTIFFTREKYRMTNHKPDTIFFTCEENRIGFSRHFVSSFLSSVNSSTRLYWKILRIFLNVKRRIQDTKKNSQQRM